MKSRNVVLAALFCSLLVSCATTTLWEANNPHEVIAVSASKANEAELQAKGLPYSFDQKRGLFFVEKTQLQQTKDYIIRIVGTPVTVAFDVALPVAIVGVAVYAIAHGAPDNPSLGRAAKEREDKEWETLRAALDDIRREEHGNSVRP